jgi:diacylglycerol kinase (ATP)
MRIAPDADPSDGLLDLVLVRRVSKLRLLGVFPRVYRGRHVGHPAVSIARVERLSVELDPAQPINADGEGLGSTSGAPLEVSVERGALGVIRAGMH